MQCKIEYVDGNWILRDGDGTKTSTNGTWLFVDELFQIYDGMVFKAGQTLFRTQKLPPGSVTTTTLRKWIKGEILLFAAVGVGSLEFIIKLIITSFKLY